MKLAIVLAVAGTLLILHGTYSLTITVVRQAAALAAARDSIAMMREAHRRWHHSAMHDSLVRIVMLREPGALADSIYYRLEAVENWP